MKLLTRLGLVLLLSSLVTAPAASFSTFTNPDAVYLASTTLIPITDPDFTILNSISDGSLTVDFSTPLGARTVPGSWATWSSPPFSETSTPRVLSTDGARTVTLDFSRSVQIFGFEAEPNLFQVSPLTADFYNGAALVGSINRDVDGFEGARLFAAAYSPDGFTSVTMTIGAADYFAIAQLRYSDAPPVPEPATMVLVTGSLLGLLAKRRMRK